MSVDTLEGSSAVESAALGGDGEPLFRVLNIGGRRRGVRLERIFWRLLDDLAGRRGVKRSTLVHDVLRDDQGENVASALRCFAANAVDAERSAFATYLIPANIVGLLQQAPVPAFAINRQKKLQQVNQEFMQLLRPTPITSTGKATAEHVHLSLDTPIEELFDAAGGQPTLCNYSLQVDDRRRRGRAKMILVPGAKLETLVGFVLT